MYPRLLYLLGLTIYDRVLAQSSEPSSMSTYVETGVPTGTPIAGDYSGALRPQIHFSPPKVCNKMYHLTGNGLMYSGLGVYE